MINAYVYHWFTGQSHWERIPDLRAWIEKHNGAVIVRPPGVAKLKGHKISDTEYALEGFWALYITDQTNRFNQR